MSANENPISPFYYFMKAFLSLNRHQKRVVFEQYDRALISATVQLFQEWFQENLFKVRYEESRLIQKLIRKRRLLWNLQARKAAPNIQKKHLVRNISLIQALFEETLKKLDELRGSQPEYCNELLAHFPNSLVTVPKRRKVHEEESENKE